MAEAEDRDENTKDSEVSHVKGDIGMPDGQDLDLDMKESKDKGQPDEPRTMADEVEMNKTR